jgi:hypothetical protein
MGWKVLAAVGVAALTAAPAALAKKPPPASEWAPGVVVGYTETVRDEAGNVVAQTHQDGIPAGEVFGTADRTGSGLASATQIDPGSNLALAPSARRLAWCCSSSGSDTVSFSVTKYTLFGFVAWRYYQVDHWCWQYPNITCLNIGSGFTDVDSQETINYADHGYGWYYTWAGGPFGGHYAHRDGSISNCVFRWGCISTSYPYVDMWLNGNGAWAASGGGN